MAHDKNKLKILGLDYETQNAEAKTTNITEVGAILYEVDVEKNQWQKLTGISEFVHDFYYPPQTQKIIDITGIDDQMLRSKGITPTKAMQKLLPLVREADIIIAHKTSFDWTITLETCKRLNIAVPDKELLCTLTNFQWPSKYSCLKLGHLAWEHGLDVKAADLHRAYNDVELMVRLVSEKYDIKDVLAYARKPWIYLKGEMLGPWEGRGGDGGVQNEIGKSLGFSWEQVKGVDFIKWPKTWVTRVKVDKYDKLMQDILDSKSPFRTAKIEGLS